MAGHSDHLAAQVLAGLARRIVETPLARSIDEIERLARSDKQIYASYYQQRRAQLRQPDGEPWDTLREPTDQALFGEQKEHIRFAALTLDGLGVLNYGEWSMVLRTPMIQHRASVFEENTVVFVRDHKIPAAEVPDRVTGYRASWTDRAKLCAAKLSSKLTPDTKPAELAGLLLDQGPAGNMNAPRFVEVHIWGPITIRTVETVTLKKSRDTRRLASAARLKALVEHLNKVDVALEVRK